MEKKNKISTRYSPVDIEIKGATLHNLKSLDVKIPRNKLVVITGVSGSGKSTLAIDTLYAEGQRRYVESLSSYARQFLGKLNKPEVEYITGLSPTIAIEQKVRTRSPRSTIGTSTEIYEYLKLLFAKAGKTISPISGKEVKCHKTDDVIALIKTFQENSKCFIAAPFERNKTLPIERSLDLLQQQGFTRILVNGEMYTTNDEDNYDTIEKAKQIELLIDRVKIKHEVKLYNRIADSIESAFFEGNGYCHVYYETEKGMQKATFSNKFELDGIAFEKPSINLFSFNNSYGACKICEGLGSVIGISEEMVIPNEKLSLFEGAVACWKGEKMSQWKEQVIHTADKSKFPIHRPYNALNRKEKEMLWEGTPYFEGINQFFAMVAENAYKIQYRVMQARYRGKTTCNSCHGSRLRQDADYVKLNNHSITDLVSMSIGDLYTFFSDWKPNTEDIEISKRLVAEILQRLKFLINVGLSYLNLNRMSNTLSGGESQRINLATSLGSSLVGSIYILDEPSIGLHPIDNQRLISVLKELRDIGNCVLVVEHDEEIMRSADQIIDIGPRAGRNGGELVFQGDVATLIKEGKSLTADYFTGKRKIEIPSLRRKWNNRIILNGVYEHNLKNIDVAIPLHVIVGICGVSGSGKSTLIRNILYPALRRQLGEYGDDIGKFEHISGDIKTLSAVEMIDQNPIGKSSRSNPATYVGAWDEIRRFFSDRKLAKTRGYKPGFFSFNVKGGRCEKCEGAGVIKVEMQFMADIFLTCDECNGKRFKQEVLDVKYKDHDVNSILNMTVNEAMEFFSDENSTEERKIFQKLKPLQDTGLGYLQLGQASSTLSGGEAQRIKLASFLSKGENSSKPTLFVFDEPTTGLHFHDINKLIKSINALVNSGHSAIVIEHNMDVLKLTDWIIELGPEGGKNGGNVVFTGTPEELAKADSPTAPFMNAKLNQ